MALTENEKRRGLARVLAECSSYLQSRLVSDARITIVVRAPEALPEEASCISNDSLPLAIGALEHLARLQKQRGRQ